MSNFLFVLFSEFPTSGETPLNNGVSAVAIKNAISLLLGSYSSKRWLENQPGPELNFGRCFQKRPSIKDIGLRKNRSQIIVKQYWLMGVKECGHGVTRADIFYDCKAEALPNQLLQSLYYKTGSFKYIAISDESEPSWLELKDFQLGSAWLVTFFTSARNWKLTKNEPNFFYNKLVLKSTEKWLNYALFMLQKFR